MGHKRQHHRKDKHDGEEARRPRRRDDDFEEYGGEFVDYADFDFDRDVDVDRSALAARFERQRMSPGQRTPEERGEVFPADAEEWMGSDDDDWEDYTEAG